MYSNILVPIVFEHGNKGAEALEIAKTLAGADGKITLLHVLEDIPAYAAQHIPSGVRDHHRSEATEKLNSMAAKIDVPCETFVIHGHASSSIMEHATEHAADCIVIASHKPGFEDYFLGSTAARVVRHSKCSVHVLR